MWANHDSRDSHYRFPFGAAPAGGTVMLKLSVGGDPNCHVSLRTWIDGEGEGFIPMTSEPEGDHLLFSCEYVREEPAIVWYSFVIERSDGRVLRYGAQDGRTGGEGVMVEWQPASFQLTVYQPREVKPEWFTSSIVYQIFPDRFKRGEDWEQRAEKGAHLHEGDSDDGVRGTHRHIMRNWDQDPYYEKDDQGRIITWDFYGGTLEGIREDLPRLADMGIGTLYLNPIFEARSSHRYDTADFMQVDTMLGDDESFKRLCAEARELGISVVLDGVFNHVGADSRYFNRYNSYDEPGAWQAHLAGEPTGAAASELAAGESEGEGAEAAVAAGGEVAGAAAVSAAAGSASAKAEAAATAPAAAATDAGPRNPYASWFNFSEDGTYDAWWGVDDLPAVNEDEPSYQRFITGKDGVVRHWLAAGAAGWRLDVADELPDEFIADIKSAALAERPDALVLGEVWEDASNKISYGKLRRYLLGSELDSAMNYPFRTAVLDFLTDKMGAGDAAESLMSIAENYPPEAMYAALNLLSSHDRPRLMSVLGGALDHPEWQPWPQDFPGRLTEGERGLAKGRFWLATLLQMTYQGVPSIYYGDERGMEGLSDPYNRGPYPWGGGDMDCQTMYRNTIQLRRALPVLTEGIVRPTSSGDNVLGWWRLPAGAELADGAVDAATPGASGREPVHGPSVCVLVNRSLSESANVAIPSRGERACELIGGLELRRDGSQVALTLPPLGSAVVYFDEAESLAAPMEGGSGVICHITSVPNGGAPGTLGEPARAFVDWLAAAHQHYWQILPVNPTDSFGSPYAGSSVFAGNERLLAYSAEEMEKRFAAFEPDAAYNEFVQVNASWLDPYCCFAAVSEAMGTEAWQTWPEELRRYTPELVDDPRFAERVAYHRFAQWEFEWEWMDLRAYANERGVRIIGDIPMYVSACSADVWADPSQFCLEADGTASMQAGCPPDQFAADGQLWGNPCYRWDAMKADGYAWWMRRLARTFALYDVTRLDHFLGFQNFFGVPSGKTAKDGSWHEGPSVGFFQRARDLLGPLPILAEDLGSITPATRALLAQVGCNGMDVLQFADNDVRDGWEPHEAKVAYTSTHDNQTLVGFCATHFGMAAGDARELARRLMATAFNSKAGVVMCTLQDAALLGDEARMNTPGVAGGNWSWRATEEDLAAAAPFLAELTRNSGREVR